MKKSTLWYSVGSMSFALTSTLLLLVVSRSLGVDEAGVFGISFATAQILYIVGLFGINSYQMTDYKEVFHFGDYFWAKVASSILMALGGVLVVLLQSGDKSQTLCTLLLTLYMLVNSFAELYHALLFQKNELMISGQALLFRTVISIVSFVVALLFLKNIIWALILMNVVNILVTWIVLIRPTKKFTVWKFRWERGMQQVMKTCLPICLSLFLMTLMVNASKFAIDMVFHDDAMQGYFNILFIPLQVINLLSSFIFRPLLNRFSHYVEVRAVKPFNKLLFRQIGIISGFTLLCCLGCVLFGIPVLSWIFNIDLSGFLLELILTIIAGGILALTSLAYYLLIIFRAQKMMLLVYMIGTIIAIFSSIIMIGWWGILGAVLSFILAYTTLLLIFAFMLLKYLKGLKEND